MTMEVTHILISPSTSHAECEVGYERGLPVVMESFVHTIIKQRSPVPDALFCVPESAFSTQMVREDGQEGASNLVPCFTLFFLGLLLMEMMVWCRCCLPLSLLLLGYRCEMRARGNGRALRCRCVAGPWGDCPVRRAAQVGTSAAGDRLAARDCDLARVGGEGAGLLRRSRGQHAGSGCGRRALSSCLSEESCVCGLDPLPASVLFWWRLLALLLLEEGDEVSAASEFVAAFM